MLHGLPRPLPDLDTQPFWDGCDEDRFLIPECVACGARRWPPGPMCPVCRSQETRWIAAAGTGRVYTWMVATHPVHPTLVDQVPYVVAVVALDEGVHVVGDVDIDPAEMAADLPLELTFVQRDGRRMPTFRRVAEPE